LIARSARKLGAHDYRPSQIEGALRGAFSGDAHAGRDPSTLDPRTQAARIRAFFVDPRDARRGIGSLLLERCENEARAHGFTDAELMATLPGVKLYAARGFVGADIRRFDLGDGESMDFIPMRKSLVAP
jgi:GNAT superfamily N-acetyltransferase